MKYGIKIHTEQGQYVAVFKSEEKAKSAFWILRYLETANTSPEERLKAVSEVFASTLGVYMAENGEHFERFMRENKETVKIVFGDSYIKLKQTFINTWRKRNEYYCKNN